MYTIFFKCSGCKAHLSAEDEDVGWEFNCPTCSASLKVPSGDIVFVCGHCRKSMMAPASMVGDQFNCPKCSRPIAIPCADRELEVSERSEPDEPKPVTKLSLPDAVEEKLRPKPVVTSAEAEKRLNDYLMMKWGPDLIAVATPDDKKTPT